MRSYHFPVSRTHNRSSFKYLLVVNLPHRNRFRGDSGNNDLGFSYANIDIETKWLRSTASVPGTLPEVMTHRLATTLLVISVIHGTSKTKYMRTTGWRRNLPTRHEYIWFVFEKFSAWSVRSMYIVFNFIGLGLGFFKEIRVDTLDELIFEVIERILYVGNSAYLSNRYP